MENFGAIEYAALAFGWFLAVGFTAWSTRVGWEMARPKC